MDIGELRTTAALAHLNMPEDQLRAAFPAFEQMLQYFAAMQAADKDEKAFGGPIDALSSAGAPVASAHFRRDTPQDARDGAALVDNSGEHDGRFIVMPNVL